jgi:hypothetical protein
MINSPAVPCPTLLAQAYSLSLHPIRPHPVPIRTNLNSVLFVATLFNIQIFNQGNNFAKRRSLLRLPQNGSALAEARQNSFHSCSCSSTDTWRNDEDGSQADPDRNPSTGPSKRAAESAQCGWWLSRNCKASRSKASSVEGRRLDCVGVDSSSR